MKLLIIGHTFPEPQTTAAGSRMMQLIELFQEKNYMITFATTAGISERSVKLEDYQVTVKNVKLNDPSFDNFIRELNPGIVLFDRFITEEHFGWRVAEICPAAMRVLDTEDLHFLRKARGEAVLKGKNASDADLYSDLAKRELASILRSDLSLIISEVEMSMLIAKFRIAKETLCYLPFMIEPPSKEEIGKLPDYIERIHFITAGNFQHTPNLDSVRWLHQEIWPMIRAAIPHAEIHIYGAYTPPQILHLHDQESGFMVKGWIEDLHTVMQKARVCIAPLRFGAGLKGKIFDAMRHGTPIVTTEIGAEGINGRMDFPGAISEERDDLVKHSIEMYNNESGWLKAHENGFRILKERFDKAGHKDRIEKQLSYISSNIRRHREANFISSILQQHSLNATKFMSKWIEAKHRVNEK